MQLKNKLNIKTYIVLSILNFSQYIFIKENVNINTFIIFYTGILLNQYVLAIIVSDLTGIDTNKGLIPTWTLAFIKPLTLFCSFYYAMRENLDYILIFIEIYIFQLIILVISIKRIVKKN